MEVFDISQIKTKIVAFDFFDTVVHRNCHPEQTLYQWAKEMALELNFDVSPAILYKVRKSVENDKELGIEEMCYLDLLSGIYDKIKDKIILDVFARTGALGLEALSRGASHVTFIEADKKAAEILKQNAIVLGVFEQVRIYNTKVEKIDFDSPFDIVIADPPYEYFHDLPLSVLDRLARTAREYFVLSHPSDFDPHAIDAELLSTKAYAGSRITIFRPHEA